MRYRAALATIFKEAANCEEFQMHILEGLSNFGRRAVNSFADGNPWSFPGVLFLHRRMSRVLGKRSVLSVECEGDRFYLPVHDSFHITDTLVNHGCLDYEKFQAKLIKDALRPSMTVLDLGANIGYYTLMVARGLRGSGRVYAFEPESFNFKLLAANVWANGYTKAVPLRQAVSDIEGEVTLFKGSEIGQHSIYVDNVTRLSGLERVSTTTLDCFAERVEKVEIIKMDIQGAEGRAIRGGERLLTEQHPTLFIEISPHLLRHAGDDHRDIIELLKSWGYMLSMINESRQKLEVLDAHDVESRCRGLEDYVNVMAKTCKQ